LENVYENEYGKNNEENEAGNGTAFFMTNSYSNSLSIGCDNCRLIQTIAVVDSTTTSSFKIGQNIAIFSQKKLKENGK